LGLPRVLVIEDDADALAFLGRLLSRIPVDGVPTPTCAAALDALETLGHFDVVIADAELPDGDGVAVAVQAKRAHGSATLIISGHDIPETGLPDGIDMWIVKPVDLVGLTTAIGKLAKV
jgi:DNA-binding response OmpR family regulator